MNPQESFVTRLRCHRQRSQISLDEIASATRVKRELLEGLERNDLSGWPRGLYARAWIRGYSAIVGLDPDDTVDDFCRLYPQGDRRAQGTILELAALVASPPAYRDEFPHEDRRRRSTDVPVVADVAPGALQPAVAVVSGRGECAASPVVTRDNVRTPAKDPSSRPGLA